MAQFARPDSTVTLTNWGQSGSVHLTLDESSASDSDFTYSINNTTAELEVGLSNVSDPSVSTGHVVRFRYAKTNAGTPDSGGSNSELTVRLLQGTTVIGGTSTITVSSGTWTAGSFTLTALETDNITDYTDLRIEFAIVGGGGSPANRRGAGISWAELEVPDAAPPTTTLTPTPVAVDLGVAASSLALTLALTPTSIPSDLGVLGGTVSVVSDVELTPTPIVVDLAVTASALGLTLALTPAPTPLAVAVTAPTIGLGAVTLAPTPIPADLAVTAPTIGLGAITLAPPPIPVSLGVTSPVIGLSLALTPGAIPATLGVLGGTVQEEGVPITLTPTPVTLDLALTTPTLNLIYAIQPAPVTLSLDATPGQIDLGALTILTAPVPVGLDVFGGSVIELLPTILTPAPVTITLVVANSTVSGPVQIVSGSDHQLIEDSIAFYEEYDQLSDEMDKRRLLRDFLLAHGGKLRTDNAGYRYVLGGFFPIRYP